MRGVCLDALNPLARPSVRRLRNMGVDGVRLVGFQDERYERYHYELKAAGFKTAVVLTGSSFSDNDIPLEAQAWAYLVGGAPDLFLVGNEFNIDGAASWPTLDMFPVIWHEIARAFTQSNVPVWVGGLFSSPNLITQAIRLYRTLDPKPAGIDLHPYQETWDELVGLLVALQIAKIPVGVFEWNWASPPGILAQEKLLESATEHSMWIPWDSWQLLPEKLPGLVRGSKITRYGRAYRDALTGRLV